MGNEIKKNIRNIIIITLFVAVLFSAGYITGSRRGASEYRDQIDELEKINAEQRDRNNKIKQSNSKLETITAELSSENKRFKQRIEQAEKTIDGIENSISTDLGTIDDIIKQIREIRKTIENYEIQPDSEPVSNND